jgi:HAD superfamily phosphoserine phosphatase-like hydrolase
LENTRTAAFFRVEGTLVDRGALASAAYLASNGQGFAERALRLGALALGAPLLSFLRQADGTRAVRAAYAACRHMTEDRICELSDEYYEDLLSDRIYDRGLELVKTARKQGHRIVLLSEGIEAVVGRIAEKVKADELICNHLEFVNGETTGKLLNPVVGGHEMGVWVREYAAEHEIDLSASVAYAAHGPDLLLLAAVGQPCAVNPDFTLRGAARDADWPVLEYRT